MGGNSPLRRSSNQRTPPFGGSSTSVTRLPTIVSYEPKLRYISTFMIGSRSGSSFCPFGCGNALKAVSPFRFELNSATSILIGPVRTVAGVGGTQFIARLHICK